ncbi:hypothetical protein TNCV_948291 [Trichonephila clavipes]|nr:hypothetical protein TNCV_948291 [Trichonephila clavipes]
MHPPTTESNKGGGVPVNWQNPCMALTFSTPRIQRVNPIHLICSTSSKAMSPKRLIISKLTVEGSLLPPVYTEAWTKKNTKYPEEYIFLLTKRCTRQT